MALQDAVRLINLHTLSLSYSACTCNLCACQSQFCQCSNGLKALVQKKKQAHVRKQHIGHCRDVRALLGARTNHDDSFMMRGPLHGKQEMLRISNAFATVATKFENSGKKWRRT